MSSPLDASAFDALVKRLSSAYSPETLPTREPIEDFVYSFLLWQANSTKAEHALNRIKAEIVDFNDLRVCRNEEITALLGKQYPIGEERALRLKTALHDIYLREYVVDIAPLSSQNKRDIRKYLDSLDGTPQFVAARVAITSFDAHAVPIDDQLLSALIEEGVIDGAADIPKAASALERKVKATDGLQTHLLLQAWVDDGAPAKAGGRTKSKSSSATGKKKTSGSKKKAKSRAS